MPFEGLAPKMPRTLFHGPGFANSLPGAKDSGMSELHTMSGAGPASL